MKLPKCPECKSDDYDVNQERTEGFCFSCGCWFTIKDGKAEACGEIAPVVSPPGIPLGLEEEE